MRKYQILLLLILPVSDAWASDSTLNWQQWKKNWSIEKIDCQSIHQQPNNLIRSIEILDMRSDTSMWGLYTGRGQKPYAVKSEEKLGALLNNKLATNVAGLQLLFVVKNFWINEENITVRTAKLVLPSPTGGATTSGGQPISLSTTKMRCSIDAFVKSNDSYITLVRIDTTLIDHKKVSKATERIIDRAIEHISNKISVAIQAKAYASRKSVAMETIFNSYYSIYKAPVLNSISFPKGVYFTWEQFKNNQPDPINFTIQTNEKEPPTLYLKDETGKEILTRDVFALSDGTKLFKVQKGYVFEIFCDHHCIYWMGVERQDISSRSIPLFIPGPGVAGFGSESVGTKMKVLLTPYLMNLENGQEY